MELIYLYIKDDGKNIKDCEFNFSPEYRISYDRNKNFLTVYKNENYIANFWDSDNISNITGIIGMNGAGKSNLLEFIFRYYTSAFGLSDISEKQIIHIYKFNNELYINKPKINSNYSLLDQHYIQYPLNNYKNDVTTKLIYYSPHYEKNILSDLGSVVLSNDVSTGGLLRKYGKDREFISNESKSFSDIGRLIIEDTFRQIDLFVFSNATYFKSVNLPYALNISFKEGANRLKTDNVLYNNLFVDKPLHELDFAEHIKNRFLYFLFKDDRCINTINIEDEISSFDSFINQTYAKNLYLELIKLYNEGNVIFKKYPEQMGARADYVLTFGIKRESISFDLCVGLYHYYFKNQAFADFKFFETKNITYNDILLSWVGLSAGELEYVNFLARIYSSLSEVIINHRMKTKTQKPPDKIKNIILLLDEPENSFHPEWQRVFLDNLIHFLNETLKHYSFQIIIASHSPILISDIPKDNVIFLNKNEDGTCNVIDSIYRENTFGANIHTLYRNSFFVEGLPIGEFAKKKINRLFEELENEQSLRPSILKEIRMIGEPILREQLMKLYTQRDGLSEGVNRKIAELEKELESLKKRLNDKS